MTERYRALSETARARILNPVSGGQCHIISGGSPSPV